MPAHLEELRAVAERLPLGDPDARRLRGLVVDLIDVLLGRPADHPDVNLSGARFAPPSPEVLGVAVPGTAAAAGMGVQQRRRALPAAPVAAGADPSADEMRALERAAELENEQPAAGGEPPPPMTIAEALERAAAKRNAAAAKNEKPTPNGGH